MCQHPYEFLEYLGMPFRESEDLTLGFFYIYVCFSLAILWIQTFFFWEIFIGLYLLFK